MASNRRNFIRNITLGAGTLATGVSAFASDNDQDSYSKVVETAEQKFNMCGYAAPKLDKVRIGFVGLGMRGPGAVQRMSHIEGVEIVALCDKRPEKITAAQAILEKAGLPKAKEYTGNDGWKAMAQSNDIDLIYSATPWALHAPIAIFAMNNGKHVATEVPAALTEKECWELVETSEKTKKHCMMLENCCYDFFELLTLNMARHGLFGELVHAEGAYIHDLRELNFSQKGYADMWRLRENAKRNGNLYPTHGLGPIAQCLDINRGDRMEHLVSMSSNDFMMGPMAKELASKDKSYNEFSTAKFRGNMNTTMVRTSHGKTMMLQHDVTSPRPYSRIHVISGTNGSASKYPAPERISFGHNWLKPEEMKQYEKQYTPEIVKHVGEIAKKIGGHGGMDFMMDWRLIDCLRNGLPLDQDVYDAASWSAVGIFSEKSVANKSRTVDIPDYTRGAWKMNKPVNLTLAGGGNTGVRNLKEG
jgi:predicted dehydrogenase